MATVIRFARHGTKKKPFFRMVVQDHRSARDGRFIEHIGHYRPTHGESSLSVDRARLEYWLSKGAQLSDSVKNRLKRRTPATVTDGSPKVVETAPSASAPKVSETKEMDA